jgi:hypothetical protein
MMFSFVSLSAIVKKVNITWITPEYYNIICECLSNGLKIKDITINIDRRMNINLIKLLCALNYINLGGKINDYS